MAKRRGPLTVRVVPLRSREAGDARVGGTIDERLALVSELSRAAWAATGKSIPGYPRSEMPVRIARLGERRDRD